jgi:hypothetical protein
MVLLFGCVIEEHGHMKTMKSVFSATLILVLTAMLQGCMAGKQLMTGAADPSEVKGTYTLLLYGCHYPTQIQDVAILVDEAGRYPVQIYDLDTSYTVKKGIPAEQALSEADRFVRCSTNKIWRTEMRKILDDSGGIIGYEVRPLFMPVEFGTADVIRTSYSLHEGTVRAYIRLFPDVERQQQQGPSDGRGDSSSGM